MEKSAPDDLAAPLAQPLMAPLARPDLEDEALAFDPSSIVEAAEQLLREGAPHDFDVLVIGAGPGGLALATEAARGGLHVALVEAGEVGGAALHLGARSKALLQAVALRAEVARAARLGLRCDAPAGFDWAEMQEHARQVVRELQTRAESELEAAGVESLRGRARFVEAHTLEIVAASAATPARRVTAVHVVIAVGGAPNRAALAGGAAFGVVTCEQILQQNGVPPRLAVLGAGAPAVEFAALFAALGAQVTLVAEGELLPGEDTDLRAAMRRSLQESGVRLETGARAPRIEAENGSARLKWQSDGAPQECLAEQILLATPRVANVAQLELEAAGLTCDDGKIEVDEARQTSVSGVYAIGDCVRRVGWALQAEREGRELAASLLGQNEPPGARFAPCCYFTVPEMASVGLTLEDARELGIAAHAGRFALRHNERAALNGENSEEGWIKLVAERESGRLLGCQALGSGAGELVGAAAVALGVGATLLSLSSALFAWPTRAALLGVAARALRDGAEPS